MSVDRIQDDQFRKVLQHLATLAAVMPDDSDAQNHVIEAVGEIAKARKCLVEAP